MNNLTPVEAKFVFLAGLMGAHEWVARIEDVLKTFRQWTKSNTPAPTMLFYVKAVTNKIAEEPHLMDVIRPAFEDLVAETPSFQHFLDLCEAVQ